MSTSQVPADPAGIGKRSVMARTPIFGSLQRLARDFRASRATGIPVDELPELRAVARARSSMSRRAFLGGGAAALTALALPRAARARRQPSIAIVGGGIAGLTCALALADRGIASTVYEASGRVGGRMFSNRDGYWQSNQVTEWGGEMIDTGHQTIRRLARRFRLALDDLLEAQPAGSADVYRFGGAYYPKIRADADFRAMFDALQADTDAAGYPTTFDSYTPEGFELDHMSVYDWIESRVPGGHASPLGHLLDTAYAIEYGADSPDQSALNLLYLLGFQPNETELSLFGESDERFHIRGGNQRLPEAIADHLGPSVIQTGRRLVDLRRTPGARHRLTFAGGGCVDEVTADLVVLAIPFAVLAEVDTSHAGFDELKRRAILQQGRGRNGKLQLQLESRRWLGPGPWPGRANGSSYADTGYQASWEATRAQAGVPGILVLYSGGSVADAMRTTTPFAAGRDPNVQLDARRGLDQLAPVFPGLEWNGKATQSLPVLSPFFRASYMYYRVGQYTAFGGYERVPQGGVLFCGEHTSTDFQGFMEGGASEGARAAMELVRILRRTSANEPAAGSALG
jgi:monoamine oxidase